MFPSPTADPAVARTMPMRELKRPLLCTMQEYIKTSELMEEYQDDTHRADEPYGKQIGRKQSRVCCAMVGKLGTHRLLRHIPPDEQAREQTADGKEYLSGDKIEDIEKRLPSDG